MIGYWLSVLISGGPFVTHVRYADGREEYIMTPVVYSPGDVITVVKKKDGSCVVGFSGVTQIEGGF